MKYKIDEIETTSEAQDISPEDEKAWALAEHLREKVRDMFKVGDVIRWIGGGRYNYAAIKTGVGWYTTSNNAYVPKVMNFADLMEYLNSADVSEISFAATWRDVL